MNILSISKVILTPQDGWREVRKAQPSLSHLLANVVLPLSALPPLLIYHAGTRYGDMLLAGLGAKPWASIAVILFVAEVLTFLGMGWLIKQVANVHRVAATSYEAHLLAAMAPIPLWLSSLTLLVPTPVLSVAVVLMALAASCMLIYHGVYALCRMHEEIVAAAITQTVMGAGLLAWVLLLLLVVAAL